MIMNNPAKGKKSDSRRLVLIGGVVVALILFGIVLVFSPNAYSSSSDNVPDTINDKFTAAVPAVNTTVKNPVAKRFVPPSNKTKVEKPQLEKHSGTYSLKLKRNNATTTSALIDRFLNKTEHVANLKPKAKQVSSKNATKPTKPKDAKKEDVKMEDQTTSPRAPPPQPPI